MKITKMALNKSMLAAMFLMMTSAYSLNVQAGVCEAELSAWIDASYQFDLEKNAAYADLQNTKQKFTGYRDEYVNEFRNLDMDEIQSRIESIKRFLNSPPSVGNSAIKTKAGRTEELVSLCILNETAKSKRSNTTNNSQLKTDKSSQSQSANANSQDASNQDTTNNDISSNTKPLTKAELKAQKAEQQAQQDEQQAQQATHVAQDHQTKANQKRQGKRRRHEPENEAHNCIKPDFGGLYGGMENTCDFKVSYTYCGYRPTEKSWLTGMSCEKQSFGAGFVSPGRQDAAHTHGVEKLYWFACKDPAWPVDVEFDGDIKGRCHTVGGGSD